MALPPQAANALGKEAWAPQAHLCRSPPPEPAESPPPGQVSQVTAGSTTRAQFALRRHPSMRNSHLNIRQEQIRDIKAKKHDHLFNLARWFSSKSITDEWIDSNQASLLLYIAISLNTAFCLFMSFMEDSSREEDKFDPWIYTMFELFFVLGFALEFYVRVFRAGGQQTFASSTKRVVEDPLVLLSDPWCMYDLFVIFFAFLDAVVFTWVEALAAIHFVALSLLPALQILRLGRLVTELRLIIKGIFSAMQAVMWSLVLLLLIVYSAAVVFTSYFGNGPLRQDEFALDRFGSLGHSMFTLFTFATLEDFPDTVKHFLGLSWYGSAAGWGLILFILFTNLALLNLVTAVMVDSIIDILPKKRTERLARELVETVKRFGQIFEEMDTDKDGELTLKEFQRGFETNPKMKHEMMRLQITLPDVKELFRLMDFDDNGQVSEDEFIDGIFRVAPGPATKRELMGVQCDLHRMWKTIIEGQQNLEGHIENCCRSVEAQVKAAESCLKDELSNARMNLQGHLETGFSTIKDDLQNRHKDLLDLLAPVSKELEQVNTKLDDLKDKFDAAAAVGAAAARTVTVGDQEDASPTLGPRDLGRFGQTGTSAPAESGPEDQSPVAEASPQSQKEDFHSPTEGPAPTPPLLPLNQGAASTVVTEGGQACADQNPIGPMGDTSPQTVRHIGHDGRSELACFSRGMDYYVGLEPSHPSLPSVLPSPTRGSAASPSPTAWQTHQLGTVDEGSPFLPAFAAGTVPPANFNFAQDYSPQRSLRVQRVFEWIVQSGHRATPLDRLVLALDQYGMQLSIAEQDLLRNMLFQVQA